MVKSISLFSGFRRGWRCHATTSQADRGCAAVALEIAAAVGKLFIGLGGKQINLNLTS